MIFYANVKKRGSILASNKIDFNTNILTMGKEEHYIMIKR